VRGEVVPRSEPLTGAMARGGPCISVLCKALARIFAASNESKPTAAEKIYLWFRKQMFGQSIFMGIRKSITLTSLK
jgi:hypothetical protein